MERSESLRVIFGSVVVIFQSWIFLVDLGCLVGLKSPSSNLVLVVLGGGCVRKEGQGWG